MMKKKAQKMTRKAHIDKTVLRAKHSGQDPFRTALDADEQVAAADKKLKNDVRRMHNQVRTADEDEHDMRRLSPRDNDNRDADLDESRDDMRDHHRHRRHTS